MPLVPPCPRCADVNPVQPVYVKGPSGSYIALTGVWYCPCYGSDRDGTFMEA